MQLRPYQQSGYNEILSSWQSGHRNVLYVLDCGGGKTVIFAKALYDYPGASVAIAHRQELVGQMSLALARFGVRHRIIAPNNVVKAIIRNHIAELGKDFYEPSSRCAVAGVDTITSYMKPTNKHHDSFMRWANQVGLWVIDEGHHLVLNNKWHTASLSFPNAYGLLVTATPQRADGKGLGRSYDGVVDHMITGPGARDLINGLPDNNGGITNYLTDYRVICPPSDLDISTVAIGADGDFIRGQLALATRKSTVMGHVVEHYIKWANGKLGVTFAPDVETATIFNKMFNEAGVRSEVVSAKTPDNIRQEIIRRFRNKQLTQLINVDLFGEGFDLPAIEVVSMARRTESYSLFHQQFMRALRPMPGKEKAIIIDHVGNVERHGLPDKVKTWTLARREKRAKQDKSDVVPMRTCLNTLCLAPYERIYPACPFCGTAPPEPVGRTAPELVDGDLFELDAETLAAMRGEVARIDRSPESVMRSLLKAGQPDIVAKSAAKNHRERQEAQGRLRDAIAWWAAHRRSAGDPDNVSYRRFFYQFGVDVLTAQTLGKVDATGLAERINNSINRVVL